MKDGRAAGLPGAWESKYCSYFCFSLSTSLFYLNFPTISATAVVKFESGKAHIAVKPENAVGTAVYVKTDTWDRLLCREIGPAIPNGVFE
jgi:hypothetical protein